MQSGRQAALLPRITSGLRQVQINQGNLSPVAHGESRLRRGVELFLGGNHRGAAKSAIAVPGPVSQPRFREAAALLCIRRGLPAGSQAFANSQAPRIPIPLQNSSPLRLTTTCLAASAVLMQHPIAPLLLGLIEQTIDRIDKGQRRVAGLGDDGADTQAEGQQLCHS